MSRMISTGCQMPLVAQTERVPRFFVQTNNPDQSDCRECLNDWQTWRLEFMPPFLLMNLSRGSEGDLYVAYLNARDHLVN